MSHTLSIQIVRQQIIVVRKNLDDDHCYCDFVIS